MAMQGEACPAYEGGARCANANDSSWGLGVALIVFGTIALAARFVPHGSWVTMWPLFFVAVGIVQMITPQRWTGWTAHRFAEGVGTALFGTVLLGCTTGYVSWSMWLTLLSLWPLLLVVGGLRILGRASKATWLSAGATFLVWGTLLFCAAGSWTGTQSFEPLSAQVIRYVTSAPEMAAANVADTVVDAVVGPLAPQGR